MKKTPLFERIPQILSFLLIFIFVGLLSIYGIKGTYSRYAQDDYCYGYKVRTLGFWNTQIYTYTHVNEYNSNRYSLTFMHSLVEILGGPKVVPVLPSLELIAWVGSLVYVFYQLQEMVFLKKNSLFAFNAALAILFFTLYLAPNLYQILFWLSAMQTYLTPMVLATFLLGRFIVFARSPKFKFRYAVELSIFCFFIGGFSETTALWQFVCWSMILGWSLIFRRKNVLAQNTTWLSLITFFSTALSLVVLAVCPANSKSIIIVHPDFQTLIRQSLFFGFEFIRVSIKSTPLPYSIIIALGFFISSATKFGDKRKPKVLIVEIFVVILILYILSVVVMVPTVYASSTYPGDRALFPADFTLVLCLFLIGWKMAELLSAFQPNAFSYRTSIIFQGLLGLALCAYMARITPRVYDKLPAYKGRAQAWDLRQVLILNEKAAGISNVIAPAFDSVYGITELHYEADNWVNQCAARYYGVQTISTIDNYAGISAHPIGK